MKLEINIEKFKKDFSVPEDENKKMLKHSTGKNISLFPYTTKFENKHKDDLIKFKACIGAFCRNIHGIDIPKDDINIDIIDEIIENVEIEEDELVLKEVIKELFFDEAAGIHTFHPKILNYIGLNNKSYDKGLADLLYDVLLDEEDLDTKEIVGNIKLYFENDSENILEKLILENLPELNKTKKNRKSNFFNLNKNVTKMFKEDIRFMLTDLEFFVENFEKLLKYYYFFYVSQSALKLSRPFEYTHSGQEILYFNLDWESVSKTRTSYSRGWKMLESNLKPLFSHANTLEILNSNNSYDEPYDYYLINKELKNYDEENKDAFCSQIEESIRIYKENVTDILWENIEIDEKYDDKVLNSINKLFKLVDYQFAKSGRKPRYEAYRKWFEEFCKINFLRRRGTLGYTLNLTQEYLLFMTKISIRDKEKMKLKDLFREFSKRGLDFDRDSQNRIVELFEKLNLIEKKSDSGDAQYVKSIL